MTAEQLHDALGILPFDLIAEADNLRRNPKKKPIPFRRWAALAACAVLVLGCGLFALRSGMLPLAGGGKSAAVMDAAEPQAEPEAPAALESNRLTDDVPAAAVPTEAGCDCSQAGEIPEATAGTPPVNTAAAEFWFADLGVTDQVHLLKNPAGLEELGLEPDIYDGDWFADFDLLLVVLPGVPSHEGLEITVGQVDDPRHWQVRIENMPSDRVDIGESLLICIPVEKGHIPRDTSFDLILE